MVSEEYILTIIGGIVVGIIVGWVGKSIEYKRRKLQLRDEKLLEGKISAYQDLFEIIGKLYVLSQNIKIKLYSYINYKDEESEKELKNIVDEFSKTGDLLTEKTSLIVFYSEQEIHYVFADIHFAIADYHSHLSKIYEKLDKITEEEIIDLEDIPGRIRNAGKELKKIARQDLGFKKEKL